MKKVNLKEVLPYMPEIILLGGAIAYFLSDLIITSSVNNLMAVAIFLILIILRWKSKFLCLCLSIILGLVSFYLQLALLSEFGEFSTGSLKGRKMLLLGSLIFISLIVVSVLMPLKYFRKNEES